MPDRDRDQRPARGGAFKNGLLPMLHRKNTDMAVFIGAQTLNKPVKYDDPDASANAELSARLPYMFATSRFAHYLKCLVRDKIGSFKDRSDVEAWLNRWIQNYVHSSPNLASEEDKAKKPWPPPRSSSRKSRTIQATTRPAST